MVVASTQKTFVSTVRESVPGHRMHSKPVALTNVDFQSIDAKSGRFKGYQSVTFSDLDIHVLSINFRFALVGTFPKSRPPLPAIKKAMAILGFSQPYSVGLLRPNMLLFNFQSDSDFQRFWIKRSWDFYGSAMNLTRWSPSFSVDCDSPLAPVWVVFEGLPVHLHDARALFHMAALLGRPIVIDSPTANFSRPSLARICIEIDVSKVLPSKIWIGNGNQCFFQSVQYEHLPVYCNCCSRLGHINSICPKHNREPKQMMPNPAEVLVPAVQRPDLNAHALDSVQTTCDDSQIPFETEITESAVKMP
ncbi:unnamed protein product [Cuscuta europaea]|uniref:DUF4283 domain-containing protein n=1 Tax=Cuscuta europaea TaxID=41803 RepID=A0A9P0ZRI7_CUSEU|nr:unnamed protein product [Cuscuta europaea]